MDNYSGCRTQPGSCGHIILRQTLFQTATKVWLLEVKYCNLLPPRAIIDLFKIVWFNHYRVHPKYCGHIQCYQVRPRFLKHEVATEISNNARTITMYQMVRFCSLSTSFKVVDKIRHIHCNKDWLTFALKKSCFLSVNKVKYWYTVDTRYLDIRGTLQKCRDIRMST